jgi:hypothetical protein
MLSAIMPNVIMLSGLMLSAIILSVWHPFYSGYFLGHFLLTHLTSAPFYTLIGLRNMWPKLLNKTCFHLLLKIYYIKYV